LSNLSKTKISGKTYTMQGVENKLGLIPRTSNFIFKLIQEACYQGWECAVSATFVEFYDRKWTDLLQKDNKAEKFDKFGFITSAKANSAQELEDFIQCAEKNRKKAATDKNENSSRSFAITTIEIKQTHMSSRDKVGLVTFVDLAGSEKFYHSKDASESIFINTTLHHLKNVVRSLAENNKYIPYRDSELTVALKKPLGQGSNTLIFINISPLKEGFAETVQI
jgi:kinesin family member C1